MWLEVSGDDYTITRSSDTVIEVGCRVIETAIWKGSLRESILGFFKGNGITLKGEEIIQVSLPCGDEFSDNYPDIRKQLSGYLLEDSIDDGFFTMSASKSRDEFIHSFRYIHQLRDKDTSAGITVSESLYRKNIQTSFGGYKMFLNNEYPVDDLRGSFINSCRALGIARPPKGFILDTLVMFFPGCGLDIEQFHSDSASMPIIALDDYWADIVTIRF